MNLNMGFMAKVWGRKQVFRLPGHGGHYDEKGRWVPPTEGFEVSLVVTILPLTSIDLQFYEGGTYTTEDVKVITDAEFYLPIGTRFDRAGATYEIREPRDYAEVAGLYRYAAKRIREVVV